MWCVVYENENKEVEHIVCFEQEPSDNDLQQLDEELRTDPMFKDNYNNFAKMSIIQVDNLYSDESEING